MVEKEKENERKRGLRVFKEEKGEGGSGVDLFKGQIDSKLNFCKSLVRNVKMIDGRDRVDRCGWFEEERWIFVGIS